MGSLKWIDDDKFGLLPFLNGVKIDQGNIKESVKEAIEDYFNSSFEGFKEKLRREGVLDRDKNGNYKFLNKLAQGKGSKEDNLEANLRDYYFNTRFATIQQMELMTVNPIFYQNGNTTDLQKRYKEIHASGNRLSVQAINPWTGELFSKRPYQTTVLFNEVKTNTEDTNSDFMNVIKAVYGKDSEIYKLLQSYDSLNPLKESDITNAEYKKVRTFLHDYPEPCATVYTNLAINCEGDVTPCNAMYYKLGNITETNIEDIWSKSQKLEKLRAIKKDDLDCRNCNLKPYCERCPGLTLLENGTLTGCCDACRLEAEMRYEVIKNQGDYLD